MLKIIQKLKTYIFLFKYRKELKYTYKTWNVALCWCSQYLKTWNCKHIDKAKLIINEFIEWTD